MGIGYALTEHFSYYQGYPQALNFHDYHIPRANDVPPIDCNFIQCDHVDGPFGALNLAEPMMISTAPAIANAIFQATGKRWRTFPLTPQVILKGSDNPDWILPTPARRAWESQSEIAQLGDAFLKKRQSSG